jgi:hypothetical protein
MLSSGSCLTGLSLSHGADDLRISGGTCPAMPHRLARTPIEHQKGNVRNKACLLYEWLVQGSNKASKRQVLPILRQELGRKGNGNGNGNGELQVVIQRMLGRDRCTGRAGTVLLIHATIPALNSWQFSLTNIRSLRLSELKAVVRRPYINTRRCSHHVEDFGTKRKCDRFRSLVHSR